MSDTPKFIDIDGDLNPFGVPPRYNFVPKDPDDVEPLKLGSLLPMPGEVRRVPDPKLARLLKLLVSALTAPVPFSITLDGPQLKAALGEYLAGEEIR